MSTSLAIRFPLGHYHATPWGRAANEGVVEWPPSPWRLLRAICSSALTRSPELTRPVLEDLLDALAEPPTYLIPRYAVAHTRHYMPDSKGRRILVIDAFALVEPSTPVLVEWNADLTTGQRDMLGRLCETVPYLGRSESLVEVALLPDAASRNQLTDEGSQQLVPGATPEGLWSIRLLAPNRPLSLDSLTQRVIDVRERRQVVPEGTSWVAYPAPQPDTGRVTTPSARNRPARGGTHRSSPTSALLRLEGPVLPSITRAIRYGSLLRSALLHVAPDDSAAVARFAGRSPDGRPRQDGHRHPHFVPLDTDGDRRIDALLVWTPEGLEPDQLAALSKLSFLRQRSAGEEVAPPLRVALVGVGKPEHLVPDLSGPSPRWQSVTPFAPYRHQKPRQSDDAFFRAELQRELLTRGFDTEVLRVEAIPHRSWLDFQRRRGNGPELRATGLRFELSTSLPGPMLLGSLCHFGLGLFEPSPGR